MSIAAGFQSGIALGRAFNEGRERRRLEGIRTAAPEMSQGYTAEQGQQLEAMASAINPETGRPYYNVQAGQGGNYTVTPDFTEAQTPKAMGADSQYGVANVELQPTGLGRAGVAAQPIPFNQQRVTDFLGRRFEGELTPDRIEALRSRAMAEGISDPRLRQAALAEATRAEREAEEAPLRRQALEGQISGQAQQRQLTDVQLTDAQRKQRMQEDFDTGFADINKQTFAKPEERTDAILSLVERTQGPQAAAQLRDNYSRQELNQISLQSKKFEEGYRQSRAKGVISAMEWFDEQNTSFKLERDPKNPFRVIQVNQDGSRQLFADAKNERELGMIVDAKAKPGGWLELAKYDLDVKKAQDIADYYRARTQNERQRGGESEAQQAFQRKVDGVLEGYQTAVGLGPAGRQAAAIYAREYDQLRATAPKGLRAPPSLSALNQAQQPEKPVKVEEAGVQYKMGGKLMQTDGRGGLISAKGVLPDDRPAALKAAGVSDNDASRLMWSDDGDAVMFNNEEYDVRDKRDMKKLKEALEDYDVMQGRIAEEARLRGNPTSPSGFQGARTTGLGPASSFGVAPGAPSIYGR
jgi:hypothetical protein